jgi:glycerol-3-phosphate acyltransferase PlsY
LTGYVLGSVPFGLIYTRLAGLGDIRQIGSGNIGATNVLRTGRKGLAALTLFSDAAKGFAAVLAGQYFGGETAAALGGALAGSAAFLGHLFPVWLGFKGGKGVAVYIGVLAGLFLPAALVFCAIWLVVAAISRYSSLSALTAALLAPIPLALWSLPLYALVMSVMSVLLFIKHKNNIGNLIAGTESKIGQRAL